MPYGARERLYSSHRVKGAAFEEQRPFAQFSGRMSKALWFEQEVEKAYGYHKRSLPEIAMYLITNQRQ